MNCDSVLAVNKALEKVWNVELHAQKLHIMMYVSQDTEDLKYRKTTGVGKIISARASFNCCGASNNDFV